jgi:hypothetical protein
MRDKSRERTVALWAVHDLVANQYLLEMRKEKGRPALAFGDMSRKAIPRMYHSEHAAKSAIVAIRRTKPETLDKRHVKIKPVYLSVPL